MTPHLLVPTECLSRFSARFYSLALSITTCQVDVAKPFSFLVYFQLEATSLSLISISPNLFLFTSSCPHPNLPIPIPLPSPFFSFTPSSPDTFTLILPHRFLSHFVQDAGDVGDLNPVPAGLQTPTVIDDPIRFKATLGLFPNAQPYVAAPSEKEKEGRT